MADLQSIREQFPALKRTQSGKPVVFFDGPAGSQVPESVVNAIADALRNHNANCHGPFRTSQESDAALDDARIAVCDFLNTDHPREIVFGANMTTITLSFSRAIGRTWKPGDEVIVSSLDHDANVTPWVQAAERAGAIVHQIRARAEDCTLDQEHYLSLLNNRTKLVAVGYAANSTGTIHPVKEMIAAARSVGAMTFIDAVHMAPHGRLNVPDLGCDFLVCSAYKFFGPHVGTLWGRAELLERLQPDKLRPSPDSIPERWMTGTQNHEGICGVRAAIDYLASLGGSRSKESRRTGLDRAFQWITVHERQLAERLLSGIAKLPNFRVWGIIRPEQFTDRVPTISLTHPTLSATDLATRLGAAGIYCWGGNHYAYPFTTAMGLEPGGTLRLGMLHYNTMEEVDRCLELLADLNSR